MDSESSDSCRLFECLEERTGETEHEWDEFKVPV